MHLPPIQSIDDISLTGKRVLIRADLNVPLNNAVVGSDARIRASLPTIQRAVDAGAAVIVMSHLGRPTEGVVDAALSLQPVANRLGELLGSEVALLTKLEDSTRVATGAVAMLENVRFLSGEKANADDLARQLASLCDVFVMDAFGTAHRAQASTHGVAKFASQVCAGVLMHAELRAFASALDSPKQPMLAIIGGAKVSTKLDVLGSLADIADEIIVGGGIANTFIAAAGYNVGRSLYEPDLLETAAAIAAKVTIPIPTDVMVGNEFSESATAVVKSIGEVGDEDLIMDIGPVTARAWAKRLLAAQTIMWNGPVGVFEFDQFGEGTRVLAEAIASSEGFSIAGGGDTLAAVEKYAVEEGISYISTGGGAFLELVEGKELPAVAILGERCAEA